MNTFNVTVSIIIPTHNRCKTLKNLLDNIGRQTYAVQLMEVIVVADGCIDNTVELLESYEAPYSLRFIVKDGKGPAEARNAGAAIASGTILLFLDDDIEPSPGLVETHAQYHHQPNKVVIGYLPYSIPKNAGFFHLKLWSWWEEKFQQMSKPGYWYNYEDLLSGNFSISAALFQSVKGFNSTIRCHEDYELGYRLINVGADFLFSKNAWGYHRDTVTNLSRSLQRKKQEGRADVQLSGLYPELMQRLNLMTLGGKQALLKSLLLLFIFKLPSLTDSIAVIAQKTMSLMEEMRLRKYWEKLNLKLHEYWYIRGVAETAGTQEKLAALIQTSKPPAIHTEIEIDLKEGLPNAEETLERMRPQIVHLKYGNQLIGTIHHWVGAERLRGVHLRPFLATRFSWTFFQALTQEQEMAIRTGLD